LGLPPLFFFPPFKRIIGVKKVEKRETFPNLGLNSSKVEKEWG